MKQPKPTLISTICHDIDDYPGITDLTSWGDVKKIMTKSENAQKFEQHWNGRMYNDLKITFARFMKNADAILRGTSANAYRAIFVLGLYAMQSNYVAVSTEDLAGIIESSKPTVIKVIAELQARGAIIELVKGVKGKPSLYYINPMICTCCKVSLDSTMERKFIDTLKEKNNKAYEQLEEDLKTELEYIGIPQKPKGQIPYVLIRHVDDIDKDTLNKYKRASAANTDSTTESHSDSAPQFNNTQFKLNIQDSNSNLFTPEEEAQFTRWE